MNERRLHVWIMMGGLALTALLLFAGSAIADQPARAPDAATLQDTTSWNSGWVDIAPDTVQTFTHNLGGNPDDYTVELWFRDTDTGGLGVNSFAAGGMEVSGSLWGAHWQNLTDTSITVARRRDDVFADQVRVRVWIPDPPVWDSDWVDIAPNTLETLTHNLGGNVENYTIGLWFRDTAPAGIGINVRCYGGMEASGQLRGAAWQNFTDTTIDVWRYPNDAWADQVRVRISAPDSPDWDSGWVDVAQGAVETLTHSLGGDPNHYIVRGWQRDTAGGGIGINHRFVGGFEAGGNFFGSSWARLADETIDVLRRADDWAADQVRVRIWVKEFPVEPSFLSTTLGVGQQTDVTLTINNTGTDPLNFDLTEVGGSYTPVASSARLRARSGATHILAWTAYTDLDSEYANTLAAISQFHSDFTVAETTTTDPALLETALADKHVFLVPNQENATTYTIRSIAATWADVLDAFVRQGGTIVVTEYSSRVEPLVEGAGLMDVSLVADPNNETVRVVVPHHPVTEELSPTFTGKSGSSCFSTTDGAALIVHQARGQAYVATKDIGGGRVVLIASNFNNYNDDMARLVANAVRWSGVPWLVEEPNSGTVLPGEAADVTVTFDATGLAPGVYTAELLADISDSVSTVVTVPVTMNVTEFGLSPSTKDVDLATANPGDRLTYSIVLDNAEAAAISAVLTDTIPANTTYVANSVTSGATYNATEERIEWSGTVPGGGSQSITFQVDVNMPLNDHASVLNTALIEDLTNGISHWRQAATDIEAPILTGSDKDVTPLVVSPGDTLTFTVEMLNTGSADAVGVTLSDPIPDRATYVPGSATNGATYNATEDRIEWEGTIPASGYAPVTFQVTADQTTSGLPIINRAAIGHPWTYTTNVDATAGVLTGADILVVEDDYSYIDVRGIYAEALEANGYSRYDLFPADHVGTPPTTTLQSYVTTIWYKGNLYEALSSADQAAVQDYLDGGGRLLLTSQDIAERTSSAFLAETLHISYLEDAPTGDKGVVGISGEILEVISATIATQDPDIIEPADSLAVPIIEYTGVATGTAGVRFEEDDSRVVFLGFEFEAVAEEAEREELMGRIMNWLYGTRVYLPLVLKAYDGD